jgi:hypothetical protein
MASSTRFLFITITCTSLISESHDKAEGFGEWQSRMMQIAEDDPGLIEVALQAKISSGLEEPKACTKDHVVIVPPLPAWYPTLQTPQSASYWVLVFFHVSKVDLQRNFPCCIYKYLHVI